MTNNHRALDESDIALIECIKLTPSLYDPRNADFRFSHRKDEDWEKAALTLGLTVKDAKRRWTCLRDRYSRELKMIRLHPERNGYGNNDFFRNMDFLRTFVRKRRERRRTTIKSEDTWDKCHKEDSSSCKTTQTNTTLVVNENIININQKAASSIASHKLQHDEDSVEFNQYIQTTESSEAPTTISAQHTPVFQDKLQSSQDVANGRTSVSSIKTTCGPSAPPPAQPEHIKTQTPLGTEDDYFCKSVASVLGQLSRRHKINAKVEIYQILEKYIEIEENEMVGHGK